MKRVSDFTRINTTPNPDFPSGQILDATGKYKEDGTVINQNFLQDWYNLFQKCVRDSGIVPNGDFDTATNAQLHDACFGTPKVPITTFYNGVTALNQQDESNVRVWKENGGKTFRLEGWIGGTACAADTYMFLLPEGYRPAKNVYIHALATDVNIISTNVVYEAFSGKIKSLDAITSSSGENRHYFNVSIPLD